MVTSSYWIMVNCTHLGFNLTHIRWISIFSFTSFMALGQRLLNHKWIKSFIYEFKDLILKIKLLYYLYICDRAGSSICRAHFLHIKHYHWLCIVRLIAAHHSLAPPCTHQENSWIHVVDHILSLHHFKHLMTGIVDWFRWITVLCQFCF